MKYEESMERSAELLRKALPLMSRQAAGLHPVSYAVWYAYVAQHDPVLTAAVDTHLAEHGQLDEAITQALYQRHLAPGVNGLEVELKVADGLHRVMASMADSAALANDETARFGTSLSRLSLALTAPGQAPDHALAETLAETRQMQQAMASLQSRLNESQREISNLREEVRRARHEALADELTGLANRRAFDQRLAACLAEAVAQASPAPCLVVGDIDHFKAINDSYGHSFGDAVLRAVAEVLRSVLPADCLAARIGGEEFALLLVGGSLSEAQDVAERARQRIGAARVRRQATDETIARVTLSLGVTQLKPGESAREFCDRADQALYRSKKGGRDRVTVVVAG